MGRKKRSHYRLLVVFLSTSFVAAVSNFTNNPVTQVTTGSNPGPAAPAFDTSSVEGQFQTLNNMAADCEKAAQMSGLMGAAMSTGMNAAVSGGMGWNTAMAAACSTAGSGASGLMSLAGGGNFSGATDASGCMPYFMVTPPQQMSCEQVWGASGKAYINSLKMTAQLQTCAASCRQSKFTSMMQEARCMQSKSLLLESFIRKFQPVFQQALQGSVQVLAQYEKAISDETNQISQMDSRLNGDAKSPGLKKMLQQLQSTTLPNIANQKAKLQQTATDTAKMDKAIKMLPQVEQAGLMMKCFDTQPIAQFQGTGLSQAMSAKDYLLWHMAQDGRIGSLDSSGRLRLEQGNVATGIANATTSNLKTTFLDQIDQNTPAQDFKPPNSLDELSQGVGGSVTILTPSDVMKYYGNAIAQFKLRNYASGQASSANTINFVQTQLQYCYNQAVSKVKSRQNSGVTQYANLNAQLAQRKQQQTADANTLMNQAVQSYQDLRNTMSEVTTTPNMQGCEKNNVQIKIGCVGDLYNRIQDEITGGPTAQSNTMIFRSTRGDDYNVSFPCKGVSNCINELTVKQRALTQDKGKLDQQEFQYKVDTRNATQSAVTRLRQFLSPFTNQLQQMNTSLLNSFNAVTGAGLPMATPYGQSELEYDEKSGLPKQPTPASMVTLLGGGASPPLSGSAQLAQIISMSQQQQGIAQSAMMQVSQINGWLSNLPTMCAQKLAEKDLSDALSQANSARYCAMEQECQGGTPQQMMRNLNGISAANPNIDSSLITSLRTGYQNACKSIPSSEDYYRAHPTWQTQNNRMNTQSNYLQNYYSMPNSLQGYQVNEIIANPALYGQWQAHVQANYGAAQYNTFNNKVNIYNTAQTSRNGLQTRLDETYTDRLTYGAGELTGTAGCGSLSNVVQRTQAVSDSVRGAAAGGAH